MRYYIRSVVSSDFMLHTGNAHVLYKLVRSMILIHKFGGG